MTQNQTTLVSVVVFAHPGRTAADIADAAMNMSPQDPPIVSYVALGTVSTKDDLPVPSGLFRLCIQLHRLTGTKKLPERITEAVKEVAKVYSLTKKFGREDVPMPAEPVALRGKLKVSGTKRSNPTLLELELTNMSTISTGRFKRAMVDWKIEKSAMEAENRS
ncbi:hypothetical protein JKP88DRAFT_289526 [Tribonema minus]|uniref:Uncharacterized protein n=1 Tax=Tribonema minus TaxID=303371 RepID=A0A835Z3L8_9STRA|nr:hypothetical protein JKP88DRAFT_289526 [Tribonema minus]